MVAHHGATVFSRLSSSSTQIVLLSTLLRIFTFSFYTHNVCTDYIYIKKKTLHFTYISLCIIFCIIEYVANKRTLNLERRGSTEQHPIEHFSPMKQ